MMKVLFWGLLIYMAYRFIFELVIPVSKTASQLKQKITEMQEQQRSFQQQQQNNAFNGGKSEGFGSDQKPSSNSAPHKEDYIDFEEIGK